MAKKADKKDFFISRNKADREWAQWMAWQLEEAGYTTVLQDWDFRPGQNFVLRMHEAATTCQRTLAVLSADYLAAEFSASEWAARFVEDPTGKEGKLITVRVQDCGQPGLLRAVIYIDLVGLDEPGAKEALLEGIKQGRAKPSKAPGFPGGQRPRFPGALPATWNVPHQRNRNFTGREDLLTQLRDKLASGEHAALTQAISGLGGVGKTQLATEYAYRHASDYELVWWVRSEEPAKLAADYAALAGGLDLPEKDAREQEVAVQAVRAWLEHNGGWLVVLDNVPGPEDVREYLPRAPTGHVIVTSRNPSWAGVASPLSVQVWDREESKQFLLKRTGQEDEEAADALAEALGDLPLALEQAAAYVEETNCALSHYTDLLRERQPDLMERGKPATEYEHTVATTWGLSFERVERENGAAADLLTLCAFLAPDDIPLDVIRAGAEHLPERLGAAAKDDLAWDDTFAALRRYSLAEVRGDAFSVHRLVQAVARRRLDEDGHRVWAEAAVAVVNEPFPTDIQTNEKAWPLCARLLPHALAAASHADRTGASPESVGRLLNQAGRYLRGRVQLGKAKEVFEWALRIDEGAYGPDHTNVARDVINLGSVLQALRDLAGARAHYERALVIDEKAYGPDHPDVARDLNNLGGVLYVQGDRAGARAHFERALQINEGAYGPDHESVAIVVNNLGNVLMALGNVAEARAHFERALQIDEKAHGPEHSNVAIRVANLGAVLRRLGDLGGARAHFERALQIDEGAYGPDHPRVALGLNNLGNVLQDLGDPAGARAAYERALEIFRRFLGDDDPNTVLVRKNLESLGPPRRGRRKS